VSHAMHSSVMQDLRQKDREERAKLVLWKHPVKTLHYFMLETYIKLHRSVYRCDW